MNEEYYNKISFEKEDQVLVFGEGVIYEDCSFKNRDLADFDFSYVQFIDCYFNGCNLSNTKLNRTAFKTVKFKDCKMLGLRFDHCAENVFLVDFENCILDLSCFYQRMLKKTLFKDCSLKETDFSAANLTEAIFNNCVLSAAVFDESNLEKADFTSAFNYTLDPDRNILKKTKFSKEHLSGLLKKYDLIIN